MDLAPGSDSRSQIRCRAKVSILVVNDGPSSSIFLISANLQSVSELNVSHSVFIEACPRVRSGNVPIFDLQSMQRISTPSLWRRPSASEVQFCSCAPKTATQIGKYPINGSITFAKVLLVEINSLEGFQR